MFKQANLDTCKSSSAREQSTEYTRHLNTCQASHVAVQTLPSPCCCSYTFHDADLLGHVYTTAMSLASNDKLFYLSSLCGVLDIETAAYLYEVSIAIFKFRGIGGT